MYVCMYVMCVCERERMWHVRMCVLCVCRVCVLCVCVLCVSFVCVCVCVCVCGEKFLCAAVIIMLLLCCVVLKLDIYITTTQFLQ